ncbi:hypothetical protein DAPPUDRAFT_262422 [Daphnia pulex]|uniref:Uncharacterized protein n=1 Tax=Daphnia pulex TaxID=6669 RepID=E9HMY9_DAPPU|nr:hypothetical protein DAPPUDRAFT_262422 [Daphnia pulex]|eukprot:EFX66895.1 hypothetical protein DAPPUDRAFT_262422 [Daphnia pulex]
MSRPIRKKKVVNRFGDWEYTVDKEEQHLQEQHEVIVESELPHATENVGNFAEKICLRPLLSSSGAGHLFEQELTSVITPIDAPTNNLLGLSPGEVLAPEISRENSSRQTLPTILDESSLQRSDEHQPTTAVQSYHNENCLLRAPTPDPTEQFEYVADCELPLPPPQGCFPLPLPPPPEQFEYEADCELPLPPPPEQFEYVADWELPLPPPPEQFEYVAEQFEYVADCELPLPPPQGCFPLSLSESEHLQLSQSIYSCNHQTNEDTETDWNLS